MTVRRGLIEPVLHHGEKVGELLPARHGKLLAFVRTVRGGLRPIGPFADRAAAKDAVIAQFTQLSRAEDGTGAGAPDPEAVSDERCPVDDDGSTAGRGARTSRDDRTPWPGPAPAGPEKR